MTTTTLKPNESSAMFSLQELMEIEEQRLRDEESERRHRAEAAARAAAEREASRQAAEAQRLDAERRAAEEVRLRERENEVRLAAMQQAIVEQERIRVERQTVQAQESMRLENEREMARIAQQSSAHRLRRALIAVSLGTTVLMASGLGLYLGKIRPDAERRAIESAQRVADAHAALVDARSHQNAAQDEIARLQRELSEATSAAQSEQIRAKIASLQPAAPRAPVVTTSRTVTTTKTGGADTAVCLKGDPMCKTLP